MFDVCIALNPEPSYELIGWGGWPLPSNKRR